MDVAEAAGLAPAEGARHASRKVGIFGSEENATLAVGQLAVAGLSPTVLQETSNDKPFWRVVLGPAQTRADRTALLDGARKAGFQDAYITAN